jgi:hypothetical protein
MDFFINLNGIFLSNTNACSCSSIIQITESHIFMNVSLRKIGSPETSFNFYKVNCISTACEVLLNILNEKDGGFTTSLKYYYIEMMKVSTGVSKNFLFFCLFFNAKYKRGGTSIEVHHNRNTLQRQSSQCSTPRMN